MTSQLYVMNVPTPLPVRRLPRQTLHHAWAPNLRRPILFVSETQLRLWIMLEANPGVTNYCERPALSGDATTEPLADFWVMRRGREQWLSVDDDSAEQADVPDWQTATQSYRSAPSVEIISKQEIERYRIYRHFRCRSQVQISRFR